jgi:hypothetical protein
VKRIQGRRRRGGGGEEEEEEEEDTHIGHTQAFKRRSVLSV